MHASGRYVNGIARSRFRLRAAAAGPDKGGAKAPRYMRNARSAFAVLRSPLSVHSYRSASVGFTRVARRPARTLAPRATLMRMAAASA